MSIKIVSVELFAGPSGLCAPDNLETALKMLKLPKIISNRTRLLAK